MSQKPLLSHVLNISTGFVIKYTPLYWMNFVLYQRFRTATKNLARHLFIVTGFIFIMWLLSDSSSYSASPLTELQEIEKVSAADPHRFLFMEWQRSFKNNGLGNHLFWLASQIGITSYNHFTPVVPSYSPLVIHFATVAGVTKVVDNKEYDYLFLHAQDLPEHHVYSKICCIYLPFTEHLSRRSEKSDVILRGAFQSFKYFHPKYEKQIKKIFTFADDVKSAARDHLSNITSVEGFSHSESKIYIGIHVRRGDVGKTHLHHFGHQLAPKTYFDQARTYMDQKLGSNNIVYVVTSNDMLWSKGAIKGHNVVYVDAAVKPEISMNIMILMDHLIISVGTFSWWCAYLSHAQEIIYYNATPRVGSFYDVTFRGEDYWLPNWIGMS